MSDHGRDEVRAESQETSGDVDLRPHDAEHKRCGLLGRKHTHTLVVVGGLSEGAGRAAAVVEPGRKVDERVDCAAQHQRRDHDERDAGKAASVLKTQVGVVRAVSQAVIVAQPKGRQERHSHGEHTDRHRKSRDPKP
jgi:hypothetical protein